MNRGSSGVERREAAHETGFNEAPIHESGKWFGCAIGPEAINRFNEAPIHESGKSPKNAPNGLRISSFNEAPIHESGK